METKLLLFGALTPGLIAGIVILLAWLAKGTGHENARPQRIALAITGLAFALALLISFIYTEGLPTLPPHSRWQWLFHIAIAIGIIASFGALLPWRVVTVIVTGPLCAVAAGLMLSPPPAEAPPWLWKIALIGAVIFLYAATQPIAARRGGGLIAFAFMLAFTASSFIIMEARFSKLAVIAGAMAAACGFAWAASLLRPQSFSLSIAGSAILATILPTLLILGRLYDYASLPLFAFILAAVTPIGLWIGEIPALRRKTILAPIAAIIAVSIMAAAAMWLTTFAEPPPVYEY